MKSLIYLGPDKLELQEHSIPAGDIIVKVLSSGICGTDLKTYLHGHHNFIPPIILGHECIGRITEVNVQNSRFKEGDYVAVAPYLECEECDHCRRGIPELCKNKTFLKTGCFCEYIALDAAYAERALFCIKNDNPVYTLVEPLACVLMGMSMLQDDMTEFLIVGGGPMGALFANNLAASDKQVSVVEPGEWRRTELEKLKGVNVYSDRSEIEDKQYDVVVLAVNIPELADVYLPMIKDGGDLLLFSGYPKNKKMTIDPYHIHYREINISGCSGYSRQHFENALSVIKEHEDDFIGLISHYYSLDKSEEAFALLKNGKGMKVVITM